jgi:leucyl-tRNA synthetase
MWGTPIPIIHCPTCGPVPVPESQLPVLLPDDVEFRPTGESPLKLHDGFRRTTCPACGGAAERETDTMDTFVDSSWYQYRYLGPHDAERPFDPDEAAYWLPVDLYTGGAEHAVMHLLYARFFHKVMRDMGLFDAARAAHPERNWDEPFPRLFNQGVITSYAYRLPDGRFVPYADVDWEAEKPVHRSTREPLVESVEKMSKSKFNVIAPDEYVERYGADVVRLFLMFIGPWEQGGPWSPRGVDGVVRFLNRCWSLASEAPGAGADARVGSESGTHAAAVRELQRATHQTLRKVTHDLERFSFNTMVAALMEFTNTLQRLRSTSVAATPAWREALETLALMLAPGAPHLAEEMWEALGRPFSIHRARWPAWSEELAAEETVEIVVQVNGRLRERLRVPVGADEAEVRRHVAASQKLAAELAGKAERKFIYVPGRLVNIVV